MAPGTSYMSLRENLATILDRVIDDQEIYHRTAERLTGSGSCASRRTCRLDGDGPPSPLAP